MINVYLISADYVHFADCIVVRRLVLGFCFISAYGCLDICERHAI
jgi:hypothetical protein